jgi:hypothetical protein
LQPDPDVGQPHAFDASIAADLAPEQAAGLEHGALTVGAELAGELLGGASVVWQPTQRTAIQIQERRVVAAPQLQAETEAGLSRASVTR